MIRINLLPVREARRKAAAREQLVLLGGTVIVTALLCWVAQAAIGARVSRARSEVAQLKQMIDQYKPQQKEIQELKKRKGEIEKKLQIIAELEQSRSGPVHLLEELSDRIPQRVWLTQLDAENGQVKLKGMSLDNELVARFLTSLGSSKYFKNVELEGTELKQVNDLKLNSFEIHATLTQPGDSGGASSSGDAGGS